MAVFKYGNFTRVKLTVSADKDFLGPEGEAKAVVDFNEAVIVATHEDHQGYPYHVIMNEAGKTIDAYPGGLEEIK